MIQFGDHMFQMGWFNHQLVVVYLSDGIWLMFSSRWAPKANEELEELFC